LDANNHAILQPHGNTRHCRQSVTALTINQNEILIAANSAMVENYLRLHSKQLRQQLRKTFNFEQTLKFRTVPDSLLKIEQHERLYPPRQVSEESVEALKRNAQWIKDEDLKAAMLSLAESLKTRRKSTSQCEHRVDAPFANPFTVLRTQFYFAGINSRAPPWRGRDFQVQYNRNPFRCQRTNVSGGRHSGLKIFSVCKHAGHRR
jgi:hypothetical protein